ncbi:MAG: hypothetical protein ABIG37_03730 [Nanoarchaeota archaeon]|nr:hypothetical protein [Nanoarchaeota archaeon]
MISMSVLEILSEKFPVGDINLFVINLILAIIWLGVGIILGKFAGFVLRKGVEKANIQRSVRNSFVELIITVVKWSIYILFISIALEQLDIPELTNWITSVLVVIPALVGALILIAVGFSISIYLRDLIEESGILGCKILSMIFFYFVLYVFMVYAVKTALISQNKTTVDMIILILTGIVSASVAWWHVKNKEK